MKRIIALLLVVVTLSLTFATNIFANERASIDHSEQEYVPKVITMLFDNSGSMNDNDKYVYALYAMQFLISILNEKDTLLIVPLNKQSKPVGESDFIDVDLKNPDRESVMKSTVEMIFNSELETDKQIYGIRGETPSTSIDVALNKQAELMKNSVGENKDYWFFVLSDGAFQDTNKKDWDKKKLEEKVDSIMSNANFNMVYISVERERDEDEEASGTDLRGSDVDKKYSNFYPYLSNEKSIFASMSEIANLMTQRFTLTDNFYSVIGNTVSIDLDRIGFSLRNITMVLPDTKNEVSVSSVKSTTSQIGITRNCNLKQKHGKSALTLKGNVTTVAGSKPITGGKVDVTYEGTLPSKDQMIILVEPALYVLPSFKLKDDGGVKEIDIQYINENLYDGVKLEVGYKVYDEATNKEVKLNSMFENIDGSVTYNGNHITFGKDISLVVGSNPIEVTLTAKSGLVSYTMKGSVDCVVNSDPSFFRVEKSFKDLQDGKSNTSFKVYYDSKLVSKADLEKNYVIETIITRPDNSQINATYTIDNDGTINVPVDLSNEMSGSHLLSFTIKLKSNGIKRSSSQELYKEAEYNYAIIGTTNNNPSDKNVFNSTYSITLNDKVLSKDEVSKLDIKATAIGKDKTVNLEHTISGDGKISVIFNAEDMDYGDYTIKLFVKDSLGNTSSCDQSVHKSISSLSVESTGSHDLSMSELQLLKNDKYFTYELKADGKPIDWSSEFITYTVKIGDDDITNYCTFDGNKLYYQPSSDRVGALRDSLGTGIVTVIANSTEDASITNSTNDKVTLTPSVYEIILKDSSVDIDKYNFDKDNYIKYVVKCDGEELTSADLKKEKDNIKVKSEMPKWWPIGADFDISDNGEIVVRAEKIKGKFYSYFASLFIPVGEKNVTIEAFRESEQSSFKVGNCNVVEGLKRAIVLLLVLIAIAYVIYLIYLIVTYPMVNRFGRKQYLVKIDLGIRNRAGISNDDDSKSKVKKYEGETISDIQLSKKQELTRQVIIWKRLIPFAEWIKKTRFSQMVTFGGVDFYATTNKKGCAVVSHKKLTKFKFGDRQQTEDIFKNLNLWIHNMYKGGRSIKLRTNYEASTCKNTENLSYRKENFTFITIKDLSTNSRPTLLAFMYRD